MVRFALEGPAKMLDFVRYLKARRPYRAAAATRVTHRRRSCRRPRGLRAPPRRPRRNGRAPDCRGRERPRSFRRVRYDDLGLGIAVAGDVAGEGVDVGHDDRSALRPGRSANARAAGDARDGGFSLKRSEHELGAAHEIETRPIELRPMTVNERAKIRCVRDRIAFVAE